jgi:amidase
MTQELSVKDHLNSFLDLPDIPVPNAPDGQLSGLTLAVKDIFDVATIKPELVIP